MQTEVRSTRALLQDALAATRPPTSTIEDAAVQLRLIIAALKTDSDAAHLAKAVDDLDQLAAKMSVTVSQKEASDLTSHEYIKRADETLAQIERDFPPTPIAGWRSALSFAVTSLPTLLSWQVIAIVVLLYIAMATGAPRRIEDLIRPFSTVKIGSIELTQTSAGDTKRKVERMFADARDSVVTDYGLAVQQEGLDRKLQRVVEDHLKSHLNSYGKRIESIRCTIHVDDFLLADTLYQLLDYYPDGKGHGRTWSVRFGMIGKVWRSGVDAIEATLEKNRGVLIREWGMTEREASARGHDRASFLGVHIVGPNEGRVGLFYADAKDEYAFSPTKNANETDAAYIARRSQEEKGLASKINAWCTEEGVTSSLLTIQKNLGGKAPLLKLYD
jgi:hypothetical protein